MAAMETPAAGDDWLSGLPDCLLEDVLSRLSSRQAAPTSVLSRRWRHLWRTLPCVDIDQREFRTATPSELDAFEDLGDVLLPPRHCTSPPPPDLDTLRLRVTSQNFPTAQRWIRRGLRCHPAAFHLHCDKDDNVVNVFDRAAIVTTWPEFPGLGMDLHSERRLRTLHLSGLTLPPDLATDVATGYRALEALHLADCRYQFTSLASCSLKELSIVRCERDFLASEPLLLAVPSVVSLRISVQFHAGASMRHLRSLHLSGLSLSSDFAKDVAGEYTALEALRLDDCRHDFTRLASCTLTELSVVHCHHKYLDASEPLLLAVPSVVSLRIHGRGGTARVNSECEMPSVVTASLTCLARVYEGFLSSLRHARTLNLSGFRFRALLGSDNEPADDGFPVFHRLMALHLHECNVGVHGQMLLRFLQNSPSLETLKVSNGALVDDSGSRWSMVIAGPAVYECKNLRSMELEFWGHCAVEELAQTLVGSISKQAVQPIQTFVGDGKSRVEISFA
ncbi:hypothetical protein U9M48_001307 [Paspalum notatum var. saurae]|uniref:F-box domain-containing protein n=1 Tax=Paspalum notatum var. saurae TaxID=547442 RepID=A0AAQ3PLR7_PASNO